MVEYLTGFVVEKSLALDNVFVIAMIFGYPAIPRKPVPSALLGHPRGNRPADYLDRIGRHSGRGVRLGALPVRRLPHRHRAEDAVVGRRGTDLSKNPLLKLILSRFRVTDQLHGERFFIPLPDARTGRPVAYMTPLFLALLLIEVAEVIFAVDSVPAIFAITTDPYIVYTSNIFAILGLRALYFAVSAVLHRFAHVKQASAILLVSIGSKIFVADLCGWTKAPRRVVAYDHIRHPLRWSSLFGLARAPSPGRERGRVISLDVPAPASRP